jgi:serine/threonine protein kinase
MDFTPISYLTDFASARSASVEFRDWCMPDTYRAPEILMGVRWAGQVDIWSIGILVSPSMGSVPMFADPP